MILDPLRPFVPPEWTGKNIWLKSRPRRPSRGPRSSRTSSQLPAPSSKLHVTKLHVTKLHVTKLHVIVTCIVTWGTHKLSIQRLSRSLYLS